MAQRVDEQGLRVLDGRDTNRAYVEEVARLLNGPTSVTALEHIQVIIELLNPTFVPGQCGYCREGKHHACFGGSICAGRCCEASNKPSPSWD